MKITLLSNEYPPYVYGGAGVHVEYLSKALAAANQVDILCFGDQNVKDGALSVRGIRPEVALPYQSADGVIAVSQSMKDDVHELYGVPHNRIRIIPNGIDLEEYRSRPDEKLLASYGIDPKKPIVLFVGRITRQKGVIHLIKTIKHLHQDTQVVLCAGAPDTKESGEEMEREVEKARRNASHPIIWIAQMLPK